MKKTADTTDQGPRRNGGPVDGRIRLWELLLDNDRGAARRDNLSDGRFAELVGMNGERFGEFAVAEDLDPVVMPTFDQAAAPEHFPR